MDFHQRLCLRPVLWAKLHELTGNAFQEFFQDVMVAKFPTFVDVRTHGNLGDMSSDGLTLHDGKLYACYAPETPDAGKTIAKFKGDLTGAIDKRNGQFDTFVFVHNDVRGIHPELSAALASAKSENTNLTFELIGMRHIRDLLATLDVEQVEMLLGVQLPLSHEVNVGLVEMEELLKLLASQRLPSNSTMSLDPVSSKKLSYSALSEETQTELRTAMRFSQLIDDYYSARIDVTERDEVAARFQIEYQDAAGVANDPEDILLRLRKFLGGTGAARADVYRAQTAILAYYFQTCDIFENSPEGWLGPASVGHER